MKKIIIAILTVLGISLALNAQSGKLKRADNFYDKVAYARAAEIYTELLGSEVDSPEMQAKLADCFYQTGRTDSAVVYYQNAVNSNEVKAETLYKYAASLKENGDYKLSDEWMEKFNAKNAADKRASLFVSNKSYLTDIKSQEPYFEIKNLEINTEVEEFGGYPCGEEEVFFVSNRRNRLFVKRSHAWDGNKFLDVYKADVGNNYELIEPVFVSKKTNKRFHEGPLCFTPDLKKVFYTRNNRKKFGQRKDEEGLHKLKIYTADVDTDGSWINEKELPFCSKEYSTGHPTINATGDIMYFTSDMPGGYGGADIYKVKINEDGTLGKPENLGSKYNTEGQEMFPWMNGEGILFFASDGHVGLGGLDVFAILPETDGTLGKIINLGEPVNSSKDDFALTMRNDNLTGFLSSNRLTGKGGDDIYSFSLIRPLEIKLFVSGLITDLRSKELLPGSKVFLFDAEGNIIDSTETNEDSRYTFSVEPELEYKIAVSKEDYFKNQDQLTTQNIKSDIEELTLDIPLEKDPGIALYLLVMDSKTQEPLKDVKIKVIDNFTGEEFLNLETPETGDALKGLAGKKLEERISYNIVLEKEGYFPKEVTFNHKIEKPGVINVHDFLKGDFSLDKEVTDLADLVQINPINFDLNKYKIRPDAEVELNKIVEVMNKYPKMVVELGSHTDCRASKKYNESLSDKRAKASANYIKTKITDPDRIYGKGYGESRLLNDCFCEGKVKSTCTEDEHELNRRTEFKVIDTGSDKVKVNNSSTNSFNN